MPETECAQKAFAPDMKSFNDYYSKALDLLRKSDMDFGPGDVLRLTEAMVDYDSR